MVGHTPAKRTDMVISYATADQTADSIIERMVAVSGLAKEILVITADEAEKLTVESLGAMSASPSWLREELEREGSSFAGNLERVHRSVASVPGTTTSWWRAPTTTAKT